MYCHALLVIFLTIANFFSTLMLETSFYVDCLHPVRDHHYCDHTVPVISQIFRLKKHTFLVNFRNDACEKTQKNTNKTGDPTQL